MPTKLPPDLTKPNKPGGVRLPVFKRRTPPVAPTTDRVHVVKLPPMLADDSPVTDDATLAMVTNRAAGAEVETRIAGDMQNMRDQINALLAGLKN